MTRREHGFCHVRRRSIMSRLRSARLGLVTSARGMCTAWVRPEVSRSIATKISHVSVQLDPRSKKTCMRTSPTML